MLDLPKTRGSGGNHQVAAVCRGPRRVRADVDSLLRILLTTRWCASSGIQSAVSRNENTRTPRLRENNYNTGLRGVLFEAKHYARMGSAVWLYGWLVLRQTHQTGTVGWVLGGAPIHYREIEEETGFNRRTLERWMSVLRRNEYIETEAAPGGVVVRILKAKKHLQGPRLGNANDVQRVRNLAETVRRAG